MSDKAVQPPQAPARATLFADAVTEVVIANGVARLGLGMAGPDGQLQTVATLCIPVMQLPPIATGLTNLLQQMQAKAREAQQGRTAETASQPAATDAAFRFNG